MFRHYFSSDDDDLLEDILAHGLQPLTSSPNDSLLDRISTSIPGDEEILLVAGPHSPTRTLSASGSTLADSLAEHITNSIPVDEEIIDILTDLLKENLVNWLLLLCSAA